MAEKVTVLSLKAWWPEADPWNPWWKEMSQKLYSDLYAYNLICKHHTHSSNIIFWDRELCLSAMAWSNEQILEKDSKIAFSFPSGDERSSPISSSKPWPYQRDVLVKIGG